MKVPSQKELKERQGRKERFKWRRINNFREIECCYTCKYTIGGQLKDRKSSVFWNCELAEKEIGKPFVIIDSNFICDRWEKFTHTSVLEEITRKGKL